MRAPLLALLAVFVVGLLADAYIYVQTKRRCNNPIWSRLTLYSSIALVVLMVVVICLPARKGDNLLLQAKMWTLFSWISIYLSKYLAVIIDIIASVPRLWRRHRLKWLTRAGISLAVILFAAMWWGALINRFRLHVNEVTVSIKGLPEEFDGFTIAQFSDLHTGTFGSDTTFVSHLVDKINSLNADAIVFTGDIVNRRSDELPPFISPLQRLKAPAGVYAILGNHDYGDYNNWPSPLDKKANMELLYRLYGETPMHLLRNETFWLHRGNDSIALIGVENIGDPPFKIYGSLRKAYPNLSDSNTKILLSHNPQHWVDSISADPNANVALTLSGHTHGMQIDVAGISPAALRYATWGGLYSDSIGRKLYVNIGAGTVGIPMRLGATPEITLITLKSH